MVLSGSQSIIPEQKRKIKKNRKNGGGKTMDENREKAELLARSIVKLMKWMTVREQGLVYRLAYNIVEVPEQKKNPNFEKEPFPPAEATILRTERLLERATYQQTVKIASWQRRLLEAREKDSEK
jgi:hypothetical protein